MKAKKLLIIAPLMVLLAGCDAKASAENFYYSAKSVFEGKMIDPLLDRIDGGYREIVPETKNEKARRLFCEALSSNNAYFEMTTTKNSESSYETFTFVDNKFSSIAYSNYDSMKNKVQSDVLRASIYTSDCFYEKSETGWDKKESSETTLVDFSSFNAISKTIFGKSLVEFATPLEFILQNGKYTCTSAASVAFDETLYSSFTSNWFLTVKLDADSMFLDSFTLIARNNYKLVGSEEVIGETISYSGKCVSLRGNVIEIPTVEEAE